MAMIPNAGLQAWCARAALREMDVHETDEWWVGDDLVTRFECERVLGLGEEDRLFNFIDAEPIEKRAVKYLDRGELKVSTVRVNDGRLEFETGVRHPEYNDGEWVIVAAYRTREEAAQGHEVWLKAMTEGELPEALIDVANSELAQLLVSQGVKMTFPRGGRLQ